MRMVSNKHVTGTSMKRFKRIHVLHKVYMAKPMEKTEVKVEVEPEKEEYVVPETIIVENPPLEEQTEETVAAPKPKTTRKKKAVEIVENNEENPENNG